MHNFRPLAPSAVGCSKCVIIRPIKDEVSMILTSGGTGVYSERSAAAETLGAAVRVVFGTGIFMCVSMS